MYVQRSFHFPRDSRDTRTLHQSHYGECGRINFHGRCTQVCAVYSAYTYQRRKYNANKSHVYKRQTRKVVATQQATAKAQSQQEGLSPYFLNKHTACFAAEGEGEFHPISVDEY